MNYLSSPICNAILGIVYILKFIIIMVKVIILYYRFSTICDQWSEKISAASPAEIVVYKAHVHAEKSQTKFQVSHFNVPD